MLVEKSNYLSSIDVAFQWLDSQYYVEMWQEGTRFWLHERGEKKKKKKKKPSFSFIFFYPSFTRWL